MKCPNCKGKIVQSNLASEIENGVITTKYFCFECNTLFECTSQSGDMIEEYLDKIGEIH